MIQIQWTSRSIDEARAIARHLVEQRLVAAASIVPVESIYHWKDNIEHEPEVVVYLKTRKGLYDRVRAVIEERCSYEVPEIIFFEVEGGNPDYLGWLREQLV